MNFFIHLCCILCCNLCGRTFLVSLHKYNLKVYVTKVLLIIIFRSFLEVLLKVCCVQILTFFFQLFISTFFLFLLYVMLDIYWYILHIWEKTYFLFIVSLHPSTRASKTQELAINDLPGSSMRVMPVSFSKLLTDWTRSLGDAWSGCVDLLNRGTVHETNYIECKANHEHYKRFQHNFWNMSARSCTL